MGTQDHNTWYSSGNENAKQGNYDDALLAYDKALEIDPRHVSAWNNKGIVLSRLKRYEEAISCYDMAIELDSTYANAWYNKANALRNFAQFLVDTAADDRANAPKTITRSIALFDSADKCYDQGDILSGKRK
ncbi:hypothetical protein NSIN_20741 [Nitrosotalea sinensis]|uniref:Uncharacterized protein n=1 Tax=Nitrosotalea sinensis TaxID=1499975 RepID=A0A2H1EHK8_9ARCH|nr:tetratricopeptide repeat protein [Candidatus Nitrosotalea sinensis]SHO45684.1 hypothetical protein NSIN_20741 [Candidatus Nitrosotalea sinensis]